MFVVIYFRLRRLILAVGKLRSRCGVFVLPITGNELLKIFRLRLLLRDDVDVVVDVADDERSFGAFVSLVLRESDDTRDRAGDDLSAIFLLALRLACGDCVSE